MSDVKPTYDELGRALIVEHKANATLRQRVEALKQERDGLHCDQEELEQLRESQKLVGLALQANHKEIKEQRATIDALKVKVGELEQEREQLVDLMKTYLHPTEYKKPTKEHEQSFLIATIHAVGGAARGLNGAHAALQQQLQQREDEMNERELFHMTCANEAEEVRVTQRARLDALEGVLRLLAERYSDSTLKVGKYDSEFDTWPIYQYVGGKECCGAIAEFYSEQSAHWLVECITKAQSALATREKGEG